MDKIIFFEAKTSVGAERIAQALAKNMDISYIDKNTELKAPCVVFGQSPSVITDVDNVLKIYLYADFDFRIRLYMQENNVDEITAREYIDSTDNEHRQAYLADNGSDIGLVDNYDLCINTTFCNITKSTKLARDYIMYRIMQDCFSAVED